jgi:hypothetical protein
MHKGLKRKGEEGGVVRGREQQQPQGVAPGIPGMLQCIPKSVYN